MKKIRYLIPVIIIAAVVTATILLEKSRSNVDETVNADIGTNSGTPVYSADSPAVITDTLTLTQQDTAARTSTQQDAVQTSTQQDTAARTSTQQDAAADPVTVNGITVNRKKLIDNLDKTTDETIDYAYNQSPKNITVGNIYEGNFSGSGNVELLVIFKLLNMPHAGGLDCSVAALYDKDTYGLISQKTFRYDDCKFTVLKDSKQRGCLLFVGSTTYQGPEGPGKGYIQPSLPLSANCWTTRTT